jgi:2-keto-4-pentenoate hydratase/2-oxohepta-3-ene-1,7-dioic acid hydratase in catechol pathway
MWNGRRSLANDSSCSPQGVGMGRQPQLWLKDGDTVEVALQDVGSCVNRVVYAKSVAKL